ncbi:MAG: AAA family ATPase [Nanoarchaeota archaeon]|nr:AAA family ATPase [Nanoarchaeota archaeon]
MVHSYRDYSGRQALLEEIMIEIPFSGDTHIDLIRRMNGEKDRQTSPFYMLSVDSFDEIIYATLPKNKELENIRIGFQRRKVFADVSYFVPNSKGHLDETEFDESTLYIPVIPTGHLVRKGRASSPVLGIPGFNGIFPLLLASKTEDGMFYKGLCQGKRGMDSFECRQFSGPSSPEAVVSRFLRNSGSLNRRIVEAVACKPDNSDEEIDWNEPKSIVHYLDEYVIGQHYAKKVVAVSFSNYMARMNSGRDDLPVEHLLLLGSTGVGKTLIASLLAKKAKLPFANTTASARSGEGFKGDSLSTVFRSIWEQTKTNTPYGAVLIDEIDKIVSAGGEDNSFGPMHNDELIAWLGGTLVHIERGLQEGDAVIDTSNLLFICAGAFHDNGKKQSLADFVEKRLGRTENVVGFGAESRRKPKEADYSVLHKVRPEDLISYGLKSELVGRLTTMAVFNTLTLEDKIQILTSAKGSALERYRNLLEIKGYKADVDMEAIELIAQRCPVKTGARSLNAICSDLFLEILFDPAQFADSSKTIHITKELAEQLIRLYK